MNKRREALDAAPATPPTPLGGQAAASRPALSPTEVTVLSELSSVNYFMLRIILACTIFYRHLILVTLIIFDVFCASWGNNLKFWDCGCPPPSFADAWWCYPWQARRRRTSTISPSV